jgi:hypothetical protein
MAGRLDRWIDTNERKRGIEMEHTTDTSTVVREGDVIEFTLRGERRTAEVMIVSDDQALLDLYDGDRPVCANLSMLVDVAVFRPDDVEFIVAA